jgi:hypothetical protein
MKSALLLAVAAVTTLSGCAGSPREQGGDSEELLKSARFQADHAWYAPWNPEEFKVK